MQYAALAPRRSRPFNPAHEHAHDHGSIRPNGGRGNRRLLPALSLAVFAWLLTMHPTAAGRTYAAYGGVYISVALAWFWAVEGIRPARWDFLGVAICLAGMAVIMFAPR